jgi:DNA processing protein
MSAAPSLPSAAYAASLAGFEEMTLHRLLALLRRVPPEQAFAIAAGDEPPPPGSLVERVLAHPRLGAEVAAAWAASARARPPERVWERCCELGIEVSVLGEATHPSVLADDLLPVPVLFSRGDRSVLLGRRVAVVGTRNATAAGRQLARSFGAGLARAGVHVVSGLARGIDGAAHAGSMHELRQHADADDLGRPVAVVASGLDVVYPREHGELWREVAESGLLLGEVPPGGAPLPFRFPLRNRLIAALAEVVVVVESRERGGSLVTARLAADRAVPVMAVPGSVSSRASSGANALLRDGAAPAIDVTDILVALELDHLRLSPAPAEGRTPPRPDDLEVLATCAERPCSIGDVAVRVGRPLVDVAMSLARLEQLGWLHQSDGWFEALGCPRS